MEISETLEEHLTLLMHLQVTYPLCSFRKCSYSCPLPNQFLMLYHTFSLFSEFSSGTCHGDFQEVFRRARAHF